MSSLTRCLLCRVPLCDGREWDGAEHVCETVKGSAEVAELPVPPCGIPHQYAIAGYCRECGPLGRVPDPPSELPTEPELPSDSDHAQAEREGRAEYESELDEAIDDWMGI